MKTIKITVNNSDDAQWLMELASKLNFVTSVESIDDASRPELPRGKFTSEEEFLSMCGLWEGRDISDEDIRKQAWRKIKL